MADASARDLVIETRASLERVQEFDANSLPRVPDLGRDLNFSDAVEPASRLIFLFRQLKPEILDDLTDQMLGQIKQHTDASFNAFSSMLEFTTDQENPRASKENLVNTLRNSYDPIFTTLYPMISYGLARSADFLSLERSARATAQSIADDGAEKLKALVTAQEEANRILTDVRNVAAEQGVSQQAIYFGNESKSHGEQANFWRKWTIWIASGLGAYAVLTLFLHKISFLSPANKFEMWQLITSKFLIFGVIAYVLYLAARNFLSHKHNEIVNKHRQNALMTFKAMADATANVAQRDIVLGHAASCIYTPQETGYAAGAHEGSPQHGRIMEALPSSVRGSLE